MEERRFKKNEILKLSFEFALSIIEYCDRLNEQKKFILSNQLLRSGTSIGANLMEAQNAESKADFIHKIKIAAKESDETQYWLLLCIHSGDCQMAREIVVKLSSIQKILNAILTTLKKTSTL